ncbi:MAG: hypothetical protein JWO47_699 [Candidatus Saccharibacteria bacterium]|nr:hypothetical protein [Candidatus Saccharibacteria bacterium]
MLRTGIEVGVDLSKLNAKGFEQGGIGLVTFGLGSLMLAHGSNTYDVHEHAQTLLEELAEVGIKTAIINDNHQDLPADACGISSTLVEMVQAQLGYPPVYAPNEYGGFLTSLNALGAAARSAKVDPRRAAHVDTRFTSYWGARAAFFDRFIRVGNQDGKKHPLQMLATVTVGMATTTSLFGE